MNKWICRGDGDIHTNEQTSKLVGGYVQMKDEWCLVVAKYLFKTSHIVKNVPWLLQANNIAKLSSSWQFHWNWAKLALVSTITTPTPTPTRESTKPNLDWAWNRQIVKFWFGRTWFGLNTTPPPKKKNIKKITLHPIQCNPPTPLLLRSVINMLPLPTLT